MSWPFGISPNLFMCRLSLHEGGNGPNIRPLESSSAMRSSMTDGHSLVDYILLVADLSGALR